ncbi:MAG: exosortase [Thermodesulfobacteriota bacterium]
MLTEITKKIQWPVVAGLLLALYWQTFGAWGYDLWQDDNYSHGLLIPFVSLYFIRQRWPDLQGAVKTGYFPALLLLLAGLGLFIIGNVGAELFSQRLSFIVTLYALILLLAGWQVGKILRFPVAILFFAVPLPYILYNAIAFPLKLIASQIAVVIFNIVGMPVLRQGNIIQLPHTTLEVVDACSGIRSLMALITLAFFLASFMHRGLIKRLFILALALPVAVLANAGRVALTGYLTSYDPAWGHGSLHDFAGWAVFALSFVGLAGLSYLLQAARDRDSSSWQEAGQ